MKDYKKIINYLEKSEKLLSSQMEDNLDLLHAKINLQFAIMDLKELQHQVDLEASQMGKDYFKEVFGMDIDNFDWMNIRGVK